MSRQGLVIGYGNTLRGDDGAGVQAALRIAEKMPTLECLALTELTVELAETISRHQTIVFIDASIETHELTIDKLAPDLSRMPSQSHLHTPQGLVNLCNTLYPSTPKTVYLIAIPGSDFDYGEHVSAMTAAAVTACVTLVEKIFLSEE